MPDLDMLSLDELGDLAGEMGLSDAKSRKELITRILDEVEEGEAGFEY